MEYRQLRGIYDICDSCSDPTKCFSYMPISLLNTNHKIRTIISNRLKDIVPDIIDNVNIYVYINNAIIHWRCIHKTYTFDKDCIYLRKIASDPDFLPNKSAVIGKLVVV